MARAPMSASGRCLPVAPASCLVPNDPNASPEEGVHAPTDADSTAPGPVGLRAFRVVGFRSLRVGALQVAGLSVESVAGLIGIRMKQLLHAIG